MLSLLLKTVPVAGRVPHRLMNEPCKKVSAPLPIVTNVISIAYNGAPRPAGRPTSS